MNLIICIVITLIVARRRCWIHVLQQNKAPLKTDRCSFVFERSVSLKCKVDFLQPLPLISEGDGGMARGVTLRAMLARQWRL